MEPSRFVATFKWSCAQSRTIFQKDSLMQIRTRVFTLAAAFMIAAVPSWAGLVTEAELNGTASNNTLSAAQLIAAASFTTPAPANVFAPSSSWTATIQGRAGGNDIDFYAFDNFFTGTVLYLDVDNNPFTIDTIVSVFNPAGTLIAYGDDTDPVDPGSESISDSLLGGLTLTQTGRYYIALTVWPNFPNASLLASETELSLGGRLVTGATVGDSSFGVSGIQGTDALPYNLNVTVVAPEPTTFGLMGVALAAIGLKLRKRA